MFPDRTNPLLALRSACGVADAELVRRFADDRDAAAFELLVRRHAATVWRVCRAASRNHHSAEDAFQAAFLALARKAGSLRTPSVIGWLSRVAYHAALKARRGTPALPDGFDCPAAPAAEPDDTPAVVLAELDRLAEKYRLPLVLCHLNGLTQAEAAAALGWPVGTVATRVRRGCHALRRRLAARGVVYPAALVGPGVASEAAVKAASRFADAGSPIPLPLDRLTNEVLRMTTPKMSRLAVLVACGVLGLGGAVGLWPGGDPAGPPAASAGQVPDRGTSGRKELEEAWDHLEASAAGQTRAIVRLAADPKASTAFFREKCRPVTVSKASVKKVLADLDSDAEPTWQAAYRSIQYHDPRLVMDAPAIWAGVRTPEGRHRLWHGLTTDSPPTHPLMVKGGRWYEYDDPVEVADRPGYYSVKYRRTEAAPDAAAFPDDLEQYIIGTAKHLRARLEWQRAERVIVLLELFGTPEAMDILRSIAGGHPGVTPTIQAQAALSRLETTRK
ncbi:MAG TPA: RNA polymerase sigma factor [Urbifossiella sp.]|jgi:RNA polymerase sigma factor (sigma-70 family)|nr:RNA polymerase sigma factor [Urbifossiella sp.]